MDKTCNIFNEFPFDYDSPYNASRVEGREGGWKVQKVASNRMKIEYVIVWGMGIDELGTFLCVSKLLWVYESCEDCRTNWKKKTPDCKYLLAVRYII